MGPVLREATEYVSAGDAPNMERLSSAPGVGKAPQTTVGRTEASLGWEQIPTPRAMAGAHHAEHDGPPDLDIWPDLLRPDGSHPEQWGEA